MEELKVLYDFQILLMQQYGGISRYFYEIMTRMEKNGIDIKMPVIGNLNYYFQDYFNRPVREWNRKFYRQMWKLNCYYNSLELKYSSDAVFHPTAYNPYYLKNLKGKMIITIHDMIHENYPQYYGGNLTIEHKKVLMQRSDAIIAVSQATKNDIMRIYPCIDEDKIHVIHHGCSEPLPNEPIPCDSYIEKHKKHEKFILYVGNRDRYKNFIIFAKAICNILIEKRDLFLICVGGGEFTEEERNIFEKLGVNEQVIQEKSTDIELNWLYNHAQCFVFPSLSEGFGIPILEAFTRKCPVILSDIPCFKEVAGDAALYFDPSSESDIIEKVYMVLQGRCKESLVLAGLKRAKKFSWDKTAQDHEGLYRQILND